MASFLGTSENGLAALRRMNSELQRYPVLRDIKHLERNEIISCARSFQGKVALLDVGCGLGEDMYALKDEIDGKIVGIDNNPLAIRECTRHPKLRFLLMDAADIWFSNHAFDVAYVTVNTLGNCPMPERHIWLREMLRVSKVSLVSLYVNTENPEEMAIGHRLDYYRRLVAPDVVFEGKRFKSESAGWCGRLFTLEEIEEMFRIHGIQEYEVKRLNEILLSIKIPSQAIRDTPDTPQIGLLSWDMQTGQP